LIFGIISTYCDGTESNMVKGRTSCFKMHYCTANVTITLTTSARQ